AADAEPCLRWYCLRWRIEDWQRVLKSGCRIEDLAHHSADRLRRAIAINRQGLPGASCGNDPAGPGNPGAARRSTVLGYRTADPARLRKKKT
ncbi:MAG: hypothetical protein ACRERU_03270, partial [Methylococcales bacterium]